MIRHLLENEVAALRLLEEAGTATLRHIYRQRPDRRPVHAADLGQLVRLVLERDGALAGTVSYQRGEDRMHLPRLFVAPALLRQGLARRLVEHVAELSRAENRSFLTLFTIRETGNVAIFQRLGFLVEHEDVDETVIGILAPVLHSVFMRRRA